MLYSVLAHRSKTATHAALPKRTATCRGVSPPLSVLLASARARSSLSTQIECSDTRIECPKEAQCSAVHPSCSGGVRRQRRQWARVGHVRCRWSPRGRRRRR